MDYYREVNNCPWCNAISGEILYNIDQKTAVKQCTSCGFVYSNRVLSELGLKWYWEKYESEVHVKDALLAEKRKQMYKIEYDYIRKLLSAHARVLDIGCSNGDFLDLFNKDGFVCEGVEFGKDAYEEVSKKYKAYFGDLSSLEITGQYDLVIFRGVIQYLLSPKEDLKKAISLLDCGGMIYITSSPNSNSLCFDLFKERFTLPVNTTNYYMYSEPLLTEFMSKNGMVLLSQGQMYLGTPYENVREDILKVADALRNRKKGMEPDGCSPAFYDNMLTLVYKKE